MSTPRRLIDAAHAMSKLNQPGVTASEVGELVPLIQRKLRGYFAEAARINRTVFGKRTAVLFDEDGWPRPTVAEMIVGIKAGTGMEDLSNNAIAAGREVVSVPFDQLRAEPGKPAVYAFGQRYYSAGGPKDPKDQGSLVFFYSTRPTDLDAEDLDVPLDPLWPEQFDDLLILDIAAYLARKDGGTQRQAELAAYGEEYTAEHARWVAWLQHESVVEVRDFDHFNRINPPGVQVVG